MHVGVSKMDYCNSLYYGINARFLSILQSMQNRAVRLIRCKENRVGLSIVEYLRFHWLPVKERIFYKILLIVYNCLSKNAPAALVQMFNSGSSTRTLQVNQLRNMVPMVFEHSRDRVRSCGICRR